MLFTRNLRRRGAGIDARLSAVINARRNAWTVSRTITTLSVISFMIRSSLSQPLAAINCSVEHLLLHHAIRSKIIWTSVRPRHQGGAHGGRAPAKIVRAPAKITELIMFRLGCQKNWYFWHIWYKKIEKDQMATLCSMEAGVSG